VATENPTTFAALALDPRIAGALEALGYEEPTPIQRQAIPLLLEAHDLVGQAETGTGKTAAFALPILQRIATAPPSTGKRPTLALVLVPTRELAMQVTEAIHRYGKGIGARVLPVYGGQPIERQLRGLKDGVDVVVGTPGRIMDHMRRKTLALEHLAMVVLDEADEMLDMGFAEDIEAILAGTPTTRQTALFSATMPPRIEAIAARHLREPRRVKIQGKTKTADVGRVRQTAYVVARPHKLAALIRILDVERPTAVLVFCRTRIEVDELVETLNARGYPAGALHGGMSQEQRDRALGKLRSGSSELLVATDVAARGLDIGHLSHVVNYDLPAGPEDYVHRIGRTGRAGKDGVAITLVEPREHRFLRVIEGFTRQKIEVATVPSVADLRARRLEMTRATLREALAGGELERYRVVLDALTPEHDIVEIALAAVKLVHLSEGGDGDDEVEIPAVTPHTPRPAFGKGPAGKDKGKGGKGAGPGGKGRAPSWQVARVFIGAGREAGIRPADLVGAIANETGLAAKAIGSIEIADRFSIVEVPEEVVEDVVGIMAKVKLKGKKVVVRKDRA
jgi:ATP-dependent RNA helicase DeaD